MNRFHSAVLLGALLQACAGSAAAQASAPAGGPAALGEQRTGELVRMVRQDCGSCHGMTLKGGLGPALLPETLRHKPPESLRYTVLFGRPGTAMPAWKTILDEAEIDWIVRKLVEGFPQDRQADPAAQGERK